MIQKAIERDTIIDEIHEIRRQIAEKFGGDIKAIMDDAQKRQESSGRPVWQGTSPTLPPPKFDQSLDDK